MMRQRTDCRSLRSDPPRSALRLDLVQTGEGRPIIVGSKSTPSCQRQDRTLCMGKGFQAEGDVRESVSDPFLPLTVATICCEERSLLPGCRVDVDDIRVDRRNAHGMETRFPPDSGCPPAVILPRADLEISIAMKSGWNEGTFAQLYFPFSK